MERALSLHFPSWSTDLVWRRMRRERGPGRDTLARGVHTILIASSPRGRVVVACCGRAADRGVRPGMTGAHAAALLPPARTLIMDHDPAADARALTRLAVWAQRFSPVVAIDPPDGLLLDVTGCARAFRGERRLLARALAQIERLGIRASGAIAPTLGAAWALARFDERHAPIVARNALADLLAPLPLEALRIELATVDHLTEIGIATIGDLAAQPRAALPARFGADVLLRLDQAMGNAIETIAPVRVDPPAHAEILFDGPTTHTEAIERATRQLLDDLARRLREREAGARAITLELGRVDCVPIVLQAAFSRPCRDAAHLWSILRPRLERANLGFGVERVEVRATRTGRLGHRQDSQWNDERGGGVHADTRERAALVDLLANRLGHERVRRAHLTATHMPERLERHDSAMLTGVSADEPSPPRAPRPSLLLERPELAEGIALWPDHPPTRLRWRGREITIDLGIGPERIGPEWWQGTPSRAGSDPSEGGARDYYRVRDADGLWMWVFRDTRTARWFVHGVWA